MHSAVYCKNSAHTLCTMFTMLHTVCTLVATHCLLHTACYTLLEALCGPDCSQGSSQANQLLSPGELEWSEPGEELIDTPLSPILNWNRWTLEHAKEKRRKKMDTGHWKTQGKNWTLEQTQEKSWTVTLEKKQRKKWTLKQRNELILGEIHDQWLECRRPVLLPLSDVVGGEPIRLMHQVGVHNVHCTT